MPPRFGGAPAPKCPTCATSVYHAEQIMGPGGKSYHKRCLKCVDCGKVLDPGSVVDHDYDAYCRACHSKRFGPRGYGVGHSGLVGEYKPASAADTSPNVSPQRSGSTITRTTVSSPRAVQDQTAVPVPTLSPRTFGLSSGAATMIPRESTAPDAPPRESRDFPRRPDDSGLDRGVPLEDHDNIFSNRPAANASADEGNDDFSAPSVPRRVDLPEGRSTRPPLPPIPPLKPALIPASVTGDSRFGGGGWIPGMSPTRSSGGGSSVASIVGATVGAGRDLCPRCQKVAYAAEAVSALGCKWHKGCLRCTNCSTTLNGTNMVEKSGQPYCRRCHASTTLQDQGMITRPGLF